MSDLDPNKARQAVIWGARSESEVEAYLPANYRVMDSNMLPPYEGASYTKLAVTIEGTDVAGWTLTDYVLPRLASGSLIGKESV